MTNGSLFSKLATILIAIGVFATLTLQVIILKGLSFGPGKKSAAQTSTPNPSKFGAVPKLKPEFFEDVKKGGYTIFIRHAKKPKADGNVRSALDRGELFADIGQHPTYRGTCLSQQGKAEAWLLSQFFKKIGAPVGSVYSSPICRTRETAQGVLPAQDAQVINGLVYPHVGATDNEKFKFLAIATEIVERAPAQGKNKFIFSHGRILTQLGTVPGNRQTARFQDIKEAGVSFLKHDENGKIVSETSATLKDLIFGLRLNENLNQN